MDLINKLSNYYSGMRDKLLPQSALTNGDIDVSYKFRLLADMIFICIIFVLFFSLYYPFITEFSWPGSVFSMSFSSILLSFHAYLLLQLKQRQSHIQTAQWLILSIFIAIAVGIFLTGGALNSLTPMFLPIPIIMAFLLINKSTGLSYSALCFSLYICISSLAYLGFEFPQTIPISNSNAVQILLWIFFSITMLALILAYDGLNTSLIYQLKYEQEKQLYLATHDSLTDLANRQKFDEQLNEAIHRSNRLGNRVTLLIIDLNKFKPINDNFGHDAGDVILKHVAKQMASTIRTDDLAARIGGDEFAIILQGSMSITDTNAMLSRLILNINQPIQHNNKLLSVSASVGIASYPDQTKSEEELRKCADIAMYEAKRKGKQWVYFNASLIEE